MIIARIASVSYNGDPKTVTHASFLRGERAARDINGTLRTEGCWQHAVGINPDEVSKALAKQLSGYLYGDYVLHADFTFTIEYSTVSTEGLFWSGCDTIRCESYKVAGA